MTKAKATATRSGRSASGSPRRPSVKANTPAEKPEDKDNGAPAPDAEPAGYPEPTAEQEALAASGNMVTDPDKLREIAAAQDVVRKAELDPANDEQPAATFAEPEGEPVDRDTLPDPEKPNVFSSQDLKSTKVEPARFNDHITANTTKFNREPTDTERKLAERGDIPPIR